jgi:hypothetical protein
MSKLIPNAKSSDVAREKPAENGDLVMLINRKIRECFAVKNKAFWAFFIAKPYMIRKSDANPVLITYFPSF